MHKFIFGIALFLLSSLSYGQDSLESFSYYLKSNVCKPYESGTDINLNNWGTYALVESKSNQMRIASGDDLVIDESGVYISKNKILSISREEIRENSKYNVSNGYLHGISETDSFAVALQDELYYFLMPTKAFLYEKTSTQTLFQVDANSYLIFTKEDNGYFSILNISITNSKVSLAELDLTYRQVDQLTHSITSENTIKTYLLTPTNKDWKTLLSAFVVYDNYLLKK